MLNLLSRLNRDRFTPEVWVRRKQGELLAPYEALQVPIRECPCIMAEGPRRRLVWQVARGVLPLRRFDVVHSNCSNAWWTEPWCVRLAGVRGYLVRKSDHYLHGPKRSWEVRHRVAKRIVAVTQSIFDRFYRGTALEQKSQVIPNGVDTDQFRPADPTGQWRKQWGIPQDAWLFANLANLSPYKGQLPLLIALAVAKARGLPVYIVFAGRDLAAGETQELAREIGVADRAIFAGMVQDVPTLLADCHGMALMSPREGCSNAVLESMSCGTPVIVTHSGSEELVEDQVTGFHIDVGGIEQCVQQMQLLGSNSELRRRMGDAARERAVNHYGLDQMVRSYEAVYQAILDSKA